MSMSGSRLSAESLDDDFVRLAEADKRAYVKSQLSEKHRSWLGRLARGKVTPEEQALAAPVISLFDRTLKTNGPTFVLDSDASKNRFVLDIDPTKLPKPVKVPDKLVDHFRNMANNIKNDLNPAIFDEKDLFIGYSSYVAELDEQSYIGVAFYKQNEDELERVGVMSWDRKGFDSLDQEEQMFIAAVPGNLTIEYLATYEGFTE